MIRTANPTLNDQVFTQFDIAENRMTIQGTVNRTGILLALLILSASFTWKMVGDQANFQPWLVGGMIGGLVMAMLTVFKKAWAPVTAPIYALLEGLFLGAISALFEAQYQGIVFQAITLTFGTLAGLLIAYTSRLIKPSENFKLGVVAATGGIFFVYLISWIMNLFGANMPFIHSSGTIGIVFSLFVVVVAALNLVLDFDFIEQGVEYGAPKYMEWYGAFGLMVTLIWLYIEILRLLAKLRRR